VAGSSFGTALVRKGDGKKPLAMWEVAVAGFVGGLASADGQVISWLSSVLVMTDARLGIFCGTSLVFASFDPSLVVGK